MGRLGTFIGSVVLLVAVASPCSAQSEFGSGSTLENLRRGYGAMEEGDYEAALVHYTAAAERTGAPELRFQAYLGVGSATSALARTDEARTAYEKALAIKPGDPDALYSLGLVAKDQGRHEEAVALFADAAVRDPGFSAALTQLGIVYEILGRHEQAADACWRAYSASSEDLEALVCLGVARYHLELYGEAGQSFTAVLAKDPENARARYGLGLCKVYGDDRDGAIQEYVKLKKLDLDLARDLYERIFPDQ